MSGVGACLPLGCLGTALGQARGTTVKGTSTVKHSCQVLLWGVKGLLVESVQCQRSPGEYHHLQRSRQCSGDVNVRSQVGAPGPGGRLRHNLQRAYEALRKRCRAPSANGLSSTKAILSLSLSESYQGILELIPNLQYGRPVSLTHPDDAVLPNPQPPTPPLPYAEYLQQWDGFRLY